MPDPRPLPRAPLRPLALVITAAGLTLAFLPLAADTDLALGLPLTALGVSIAIVSLFEALGTLDGCAASGPSAAAASATWRHWLELGLASVTVVTALRLAVAGVLPWPAWLPGSLVTSSFLGLAVALARIAANFGERAGDLRPWFAREGFWLIATGTLLYLPRLGAFSLIDPWETHYAEVAREMLMRSDWITFWWAQDGLFFSKPPLLFWLVGLSFLICGVEVAPDRVIAGVAQGLAPAPEWAARLPVFLLALTAVYLLYRGVAHGCGRRVGLLSGLILLTTPFWFLLARQSVTDMPYVAALTAAFGLLLIGFTTDPETRVREHPLRLGARELRLSAYHLVFAAALLLILPQLLYLASRNVTWQLVGEPRLFFRIHPDAFLVGSGGGNCGLPSNAPCAVHWPASQGVFAQPLLTALGGATVTGFLLFATRHERRQQRLAFLGAWVAIALSTLAKGAPGLVIPLFATLAFVLVTRRGRELRRLELGPLLLLVAVIALPWLLQSTLRHGAPFLDRLILHDMYERAFVHVHDTNAGADLSFRYYLTQLGYGTFPWSGLAMVGVVAWLARPGTPRRLPSAPATLMFVWFLTAFGLFTVSRTKFHHYILPAVPPLAVLTALLLDRFLTRCATGREARALAALALLAVPWVALVGRDLATVIPGTVVGPARLMHLFVYKYDRPWPPNLDLGREFVLFAGLAATATALLISRRLRRAAAASLLALALLWTGWVTNVYLVAAAQHWGQRATIAAYYQRRQGPEEPLLAYQLYWRGENFYTGNRVVAFAADADAFSAHLAALRNGGRRVVFVVTEQRRVSRLRGDLGSVRAFELLIPPAVNNKFALVRVVL